MRVWRREVDLTLWAVVTAMGLLGVLLVVGLVVGVVEEAAKR